MSQVVSAAHPIPPQHLVLQDPEKHRELLEHEVPWLRLPPVALELVQLTQLPDNVQQSLQAHGQFLQ